MRLDGYKICVTGGGGFIGSHTAKTLRACGATVYVIDNRFIELSNKHIDKYIVDDYSSIDALDKLKNDQIDGFVHCAGTSLVGPSMQDPGLYYNNNVTKTITFLQHLSTWNTKPFVVFSSSAATYGIPTAVPITEEADLNPISPYGQTKVMIEKILADFDTAHNIRSYCYRYFNACGADTWGSELGPEEGDTHIIPKIFEAYYKGKAFQMYGTDYGTLDGTCVRDYIHVSDLALAHARACVELSNGSVSKIYNLGTNTGYSNLDLINAFKQHVGDIQVNNIERRYGDPDELVANSSKIKQELNWETKFSDIDTIMKDTKKFYDIHTQLQKPV